MNASPEETYQSLSLAAQANKVGFAGKGNFHVCPWSVKLAGGSSASGLPAPLKKRTDVYKGQKSRQQKDRVFNWYRCHSIIMRCGDFVRLRGTLLPHSVLIMGLEGRVLMGQIGKIPSDFGTGLEELKPLVLNTNLNLLGLNDLTGK